MKRARHQGGPAEEAAVMVPTVLPVAEFTIGADGAMTVTVNGAPFLPEPFAPPWRRDSFPAILDTVTDQRRLPVRVQVREADGSTFTDIITPTRRQPPPDVPTPPAPLPASAGALYGAPPGWPTAPVPGPPRPAPVPPPPPGVAVVLEGFLPGETILVTAVIATTRADANGRLVLTGDAATRPAQFFGTVSGTLVAGGQA